MNSLKVIFDYDTWQEIFSSIKKNKVRTIITVIGVLWGIFIYITLSGSSNGLDNGFDKEFENIAMNSMFIWAQRTSIPYDGFKIGRNIVLKLSVSLGTIKKRISERKTLEQRADDNEQTAIKRYKMYEKNIEPVIEFYKRSNLLTVVNGEKKISEISDEISGLIEGNKG